MDYSRWQHVSATSKLLVPLLVAALFLPVAFAQERPIADAAASMAKLVDPQAAAQQTDIEEIKIVGQRLIVDLQQRIYQAEDIAFERFNELNDDDRYDIHCVSEARTGTLIRKRMCLPNYYHGATRDNAMEFLGSLGGCDARGTCASPFLYVAPSPTARNVISYRFPIFKKKVKELVLKDPALYQAMQDLFALTERLHRARTIYHAQDKKVE